MAQDTALLRYLLKWARRAPWSWSQRDLAFAFDWTNDYISSNATIGRTGYDMNVSGNVSTGSDADGSYFWINWNRDATIPTWTNAEIQTTTNPTINQTTSFTISTKFKFNGVVPTGGSMWIFWRSNIISLYADNSAWTNLAKFRIRNWWTFTDVTFTATASTVYTIHWVYDTSVNKMYLYVNWTLQNIWWTTVWAATFWWSQNFILWDGGLWWGNVKSLSTYIYHACIRNKALTQAEIDADIALWNTAKNDPSIVAYYIPDNLTYNTQYIANPKDLSNATWTKGTGTTVTANTTVAPDGTTTADQVVWTGTSTTVSKCEHWFSTISWATIASKTFIIKAFVKVSSWTATFRLKCTHSWVADYFSTDQTATTTRQEFTFSQTFTSSTSWTGIIWWLVTSTTNSAATLEVRNVRLFLVNETLRDESPNIWWFIWWKTPLVMAAWVKPDIDSADTTTKQCFFQLPWHYMQLRATSNFFQFRSETTLQARSIATWWNTTLWTGFRWKAHLLWVKYRDWTWWKYKGYVNGVETNTGQSAYSTTLRPAGTIYRTNASVWFYSTDYRDGNIRDIRAYTFTGSFTDADALAIYNGGEPTSSWMTKYLHYRPPVGEVGTTTQDQSTNDRDWTLNNWVTRNYI